MEVIDYSQVVGHKALLKIFCEDMFTLFHWEGEYLGSGKPIGKVVSLLKQGEEILLQCEPNREVKKPQTIFVPSDTVLWTGFYLEQQGKTLGELLDEGSMGIVVDNIILKD